jgi:general secretion pathway protein G
MKTETSRVANSGFTFIELMVVIVILGILAMVIAPNFMDAPDEARQNKARLDIKSIEAALKLYKLDNGVYPSTEQGLEALVKAPESGFLPKKWRKGGYLEKRNVPKDPWGNEFVYLSPGINGDYDIISYGSDGAPGGEGFAEDINNWEIE